MPYQTTKDLPEPVKEHLPAHAEKIYKEAFNSAWRQYNTPEERRNEDDDRETVAHKVAWSAVKKVYRKAKNGQWVEK